MKFVLSLEGIDMTSFSKLIRANERLSNRVVIKDAKTIFMSIEERERHLIEDVRAIADKLGGVCSVQSPSV